MAKTFFILKAGIAPPGLSSQPTYIRVMFWSWVVDLGLKRKDWELSRGLNAKGEPLPGVLPATRRHRRSEMTPSGKGDPSAPYLMPGRGLSRTRSLLTGKPHADYAEFFWRYDPHTGDQWGRVLAWHAARGKAYDVVGLSPAGIASVAQQAQRQWRQWLATGQALAPVLPPLAPAAYGRRLPAARSEPLGRTNLTFATFGIGGTKEQAQRAIDEGRSSGFRTQDEWTRYFREKRPTPTLASPGTTSYSVRRGNSNVLLQAVWGGQPPPTATALRRAAMPPAPVAPKAVPVPPKLVTVPPKAVTVPRPATPPAFPPSTATISFGGWDDAQKKRAEDVARRVLGDVPLDRLASIVGAPDGAKVTVWDAAEASVSYTVKHPTIDMMTGDLARRDGNLVHDPMLLYVRESERGKGVGAEIHGRRVAYGVEHGVTRLKITAARGPDEIGYLVWPGMGYDGKLPKSVVENLPDQLKGRTTIQELLADEGGQKWWKKNGKTFTATFDLAPGSLSIMRWATYWARRLAGKTGK